MLEACFLSEARKGTTLLPPEPLSPRGDEHRREAGHYRVVDPWRSGVQRDRTNQFVRMRGTRGTATPKAAAAAARPSRRDGGGGDAQRAAAEELRRIYEEASQAQNTLASKLAQHNGVRQFSLEFSGERAPPLELRVLLPELEAAIDHLLDKLELSVERLKQLRPPAQQGPSAQALPAPSAAASSAEVVRDALERYVRDAHEAGRAASEQQRRQIQELTAASPLFAPAMSPVLNRRLSAALSKTGSPHSSRPSSPPGEEPLCDLQLPAAACGGGAPGGESGGDCGGTPRAVAGGCSSPGEHLKGAAPLPFS
ncbi:unnamed protein product, partial [Prorocentrum cordatum]